ncbi:FAD:protein FMN transferase [Mycetocola zhujimingii]|uniref:FAD:protein FMN transferase n=1 Tax=Mycetocola zhujimingii TaxID=2079792 RepID=UPI000D38D73B|nr:FAD:protein FMN transferase [Mycetocola zhujimingii]AWB85846.1 FAD:protein FMN transferase [Mycetocola zhujimingii]
MPTEPDELVAAGVSVAGIRFVRTPGSVAFDAIGTRWQIDSERPITPGLLTGIARRIDEFDSVWSRFRADSTVTEIAAVGGSRDLGPDAPALFSLYRRLGEASGGGVSPLVGDALVALGYDASYSFRQSGIPAPAPAVEDVAALNGTVLTVSRPVSIDVGAAGKGYLVDRVSELLLADGHTSFTVDASGDLLHSGPPIRIALEHPFDPELAIGVLSFAGGALAASATNRRAWGNGLHHVIDGRTGEPVREVVATWATADDAATADGAATALFFTGPVALRASLGAGGSGIAGADIAGRGIEGLRMFTDGSVEYSPGFSAELFR